MSVDLVMISGTHALEAHPPEAGKWSRIEDGSGSGRHVATHSNKKRARSTRPARGHSGIAQISREAVVRGTCWTDALGRCCTVHYHLKALRQTNLTRGSGPSRSGPVHGWKWTGACCPRPRLAFNQPPRPHRLPPPASIFFFFVFFFFSVRPLRSLTENKMLPPPRPSVRPWATREQFTRAVGERRRGNSQKAALITLGSYFL